MKYELDLDWISENVSTYVNGEEYSGKIAVGDTLEFGNDTYAVLGINEDAVVVKKIDTPIVTQGDK